MVNLGFVVTCANRTKELLKMGMHYPEYTLNYLHEAIWFSILDLKKGYWQVDSEEQNL